MIVKQGHVTTRVRIPRRHPQRARLVREAAQAFARPERPALPAPDTTAERRKEKWGGNGGR